MRRAGTLKRILRISSLTILLVTAFVALSSGAAQADTAYLTYNSGETGIYQYFLTNSQTGTRRTNSMTLASGASSYTWPSNSAWFTKVMPEANTVTTGTWNVYLSGSRSSGSGSIVNLSAEIGEYTSGGSYNPWLTTTNFGWTSNLTTSYVTYTLTYNDTSTHTLAAGSRMYIRVWARNNSSSSRTVNLRWDNNTYRSRAVTPAFAYPIPALGWWLLLVVVIGFSFFAVRKGALKLRRAKE